MTRAPLFFCGHRVRAGGTEFPEACEEAVRRFDVACDLRLQFVGACELFLFAEAFPKANLDAFGLEHRWGVEYVCFDGQRSAIEGGAHANVGDGAAALRFAVEQSARDVDAA